MPCRDQSRPAVAAQLGRAGITIAHAALRLLRDDKTGLYRPAGIADVLRDFFPGDIACPDLPYALQSGELLRQLACLPDRQGAAAQPVASVRLRAVRQSPLDARVARVDQQFHRNPPASPELNCFIPCAVSRRSSPRSLTPRAIPVTTDPSAMRN